MTCRETGGLLKIDHAKDNVRTTLDLDYIKKTGNASIVVTKDSMSLTSFLWSILYVCLLLFDLALGRETGKDGL